jgi:NitT/TauT family transport system substrate-binding protein
MPVVALLAGIFAPHQPAWGDDANAITIRTDFSPNGHQSAFFLAAYKGWYKQAGLDVTIDDGTGSTVGVQLAGAGQIDVAYSALSVMAFAHGKGVPVISIGVMFRKGDAGLIFPDDRGIHSVKDLKGKTLAFSAGGFEPPFIDAFLAAGGLTRDDVELVNIDPGAKTTTMIAGKVDGVFASPPVQLPLVNPHRASSAITFYDVGLTMPGYGMVTALDTIRNKGPGLRKFASITAGAWAYLMVPGHEDEGAAALMALRPQARLDPSLIEAQVRESRAYVMTPSTEHLPIGIQTDTDWAQAIKVMEAAKAIAPGTEPKDYYTNAYLDTTVIKDLGGG